LKEMIELLEKFDVDMSVLGHDVPQTKLEAMSDLRDELDRQNRVAEGSNTRKG